MIDSNVLLGLAIVINVAGFFIFTFFAASRRERIGSALLLAGMTMVLLGIYIAGDLGLVLALVAFVFVNGGGYLTYRESTA